MPKDYSRRGQGRRRPNGPKPWLWVLLSFLLGYLTASFFDINSLQDCLRKYFSSKDSLSQETRPMARQKDLPKPKFEFYTLLTKDHNPTRSLSKPTPTKVVAPSPNVPLPMEIKGENILPDKPENRPIVSIKQATEKSKEHYVLQVASFKKNQEAERLKALLTLKGFEVSIVAAPPQQGGWFRVMLGPYSSKLVAEKMQMTLARSEHLKGIIHKLPGSA